MNYKVWLPALCVMMGCIANSASPTGDELSVQGQALSAACDTDDDCRLVSDYCEGCNCLALGLGEKVPKCNGDQVQCFVDPCLNLEARCEFGSCVASSASE